MHRKQQFPPLAPIAACPDSASGDDDDVCAGDDEFFAGEETTVKPLDLLPEFLEQALQHCYLKLLEEYVDLYNGRLGRIRLDDYILPLRADYKPVHTKPYAVPRR